MTRCILTFALLLAASCDIPMDPLGGMPNRNITCLVTFDAGGGTPEPPAQPVGQGRRAAEPPSMTKTNYTLDGWYREPGLENKWDFDLNTVDLDMTLYAKWELNRYTVTFNANGGTFSGDIVKIERQVESGGTVEPPEDPHKIDHIFSGWYTQVSDGDLFNAAASVTGNISLFARWFYGYTAIDDIRAYLDNSPDGGSVDNPVFLPVNINLGNMAQAGSGWRELLDAIAAANKYVKLDLSPCAMTGNVFNQVFNLSAGKDKIVSLVLPDAAAYIADMHNSLLDSDFTALKSIGGTNIASIGGVLQGCTSLVSVDFPNVTIIGGGAFSGCTSLANVNFPAATIIGSDAFRDCTSLVNVNFPAATIIGSDVFRDCTSLTSVDFPAAASIGDSFSGCTSLTNVEFPVATSIGDYAFQNTGLTSVNFPVATIIGSSAFSGCTSLINADFPMVTSIGGSAFQGTGLTSVNFPVVTSIGGSAFQGTGLTSVNFPAATIIGSNAFFGCAELTSVTLATAANIGSSAFIGCQIKIITLTEALDTNGISSIYMGGALEKISCPKVTSIGDNAFSVCHSLTSVDFPAVVSIGGSAFQNTGLTSVNFPVATIIGSDAFSGCINLASMNFPAVTSIGGGAFYFTGSTVTITLGNPAPKVGADMFNDSPAKTVTVRYPTGATGYGTVPTDTTTNNWGNAFRGKGWNGTSYQTGTVNSNITLVYEPY